MRMPARPWSTTNMSRWVLTALLALALSACGGGDEHAATRLDGRKAALAGEEAPQALTVVSLTKVGEARVGRTVFDYTFRVTIRNDGQARGDVVAEVVGTGPGTSVVDGVATVALIDAGATAATTDTITLRHNRSFPFDPSKLVWSLRSTHAVTVRGFVIDAPVAGANVELKSLATGSIIAATTTSATGEYATPLLPQSTLAGGYSVAASGGTMNGEPFVGTLRAIYGLPSDYGQSHVTLLTTAASLAAQSTTSDPNALAAEAERIGNEAAARGLFPDLNWKSVDVAAGFGTANSTALALYGTDEFTSGLAAALVMPAPPASGETRCAPTARAGELVCSARIGPGGGRVYSESGIGNGASLALVPPLVYEFGAVEVAITLSESGNAATFRVSAARDLIYEHLRETTLRLSGRLLFQSKPIFSLPAADFIGSLNVEDRCKAEVHRNMPDCLTVEAGIQPALYVLDGSYHRVPTAPAYAHRSDSTDGGVFRRYGSNLNASRERSQDRAAVIFVHGYTARTPLEAASSVGPFGGDDGTWGAFPRLIGELVDPWNHLPQRFDRYNFQWRTNTSFYTAADDLAAAVRFAYAQSGSQKIHIIAHSFGGLLARTALQNLNGRTGDVSAMVQSLTTLGTPHSGVRDPGLFADPVVPGTQVSLPDGWDSFGWEQFCGQLTCFEAGLNASLPEWLTDEHKLHARPVVLGGVIADLQKQTTLDKLHQDQKILALIGVGFGSTVGVRNFTVATGDYLITLAGQRLRPDAAECSDETPFMFASALGNATASERVLGIQAGHCLRTSGLLNPSVLTAYTEANGLRGGDDAYYGYAHTAFMGFAGTRDEFEANEAEIPDQCGNADTCIHDAWVSTKALLLSFYGGPPSPDFAGGPVAVTGASCTAPIVGVDMICTVMGTNLPATTVFRASNCSPSPMTALAGGDATRRQFSCRPQSSGVLVEVAYEVPGFIGPLPGVPALPASDPPAPLAFSWPVEPSNASRGHHGSCAHDQTLGCYWLADASEDASVVWRDAQPFQQEPNFEVAEDRSARWHLGADYNLGSGDFEIQQGKFVYAAATGEVAKTYTNVCGWGNVLMLRHATSTGSVITVYGHVNWLDGTPPDEGKPFARGQPIAKIGKGEWTQSATCSSSGSRDAHLHFEVRLQDNVDLKGGYTEAQLQPGALGPQGQTDPDNYVREHLVPVTSGLLNDTGITADMCYRAGSDVLVNCTSPEAIALNDSQDGMVGRDVTNNDDSDGKAGFSFSLVPKPGGGFYDKTECVKDNVTGLMWEGKTSDGGARDGTRGFTNYGNGEATDSSLYVVTVNALAVCGFTDWRIPTTVEFQTIIDYGRGSPAIDLIWFPNTWLAAHAPAHWVSEGVVTPGYGQYAWAILVDNGVQSFVHRRAQMGVRLVRGVTLPETRYMVISATYSGDAENNAVLDSYTGLVWRRCAEGQIWLGVGCAGRPADFLSAAHGLAHAQTLSGWRVPNVKELASIHDKRYSDPAIDPVAFPGMPPGTTVYDSWYYTSTPVIGEFFGGSSSGGWMVQFNNGEHSLAISFAPRQPGFRGQLRLVRQF